MEHYTKGKNVELEVCVEGCLPGCVKEVEKLSVLPSTKLRDVIDSALQILKQMDQMIWVGCGPAAGKAVSGAEVIKRRIGSLHQVTRLTCKRVEEYWEPKLDGLDTLKVTREIPVVVILLSRLPLDTSLPGYQAPGMLGEDFCKPEGKLRRQRKGHTGRDCVVKDLNGNASDSYSSKNRNCDYSQTEECVREGQEGMRSERRAERGRGRGQNARMKSQYLRGNRGRGRDERTGDNKNENWKSQEENKEWERQRIGRGKEESCTWDNNGNWRSIERMNEGGHGRGRGRGRGSDNSENRIKQGMNNEGHGRGGRERMTCGDAEGWRNYERINDERHGRGQRGGRGKRERGTWDNERGRNGEERVGEFGREWGGGRGRGRRGRGGGSRRINEGICEERQENVTNYSRVKDGDAAGNEVE